MKRPDRFSQSLDRLASLSAHGLRWTGVTVKPVRSETWKVNAFPLAILGDDVRELQSAGGEELSPALCCWDAAQSALTLSPCEMASVLDKAFKAEP